MDYYLEYFSDYSKKVSTIFMFYLKVFFICYNIKRIMSETITMNRRQYENLIRKSKVGWAMFYASEHLNHGLHIGYMKTINDMIENESVKEVLPDFVESEIKDLYAQLKKTIECPICYEELNKENMKFSSCGHKYCSSCLSKINECAVCRKQIYKKDNQ